MNKENQTKHSKLFLTLGGLALLVIPGAIPTVIAYKCLEIYKEKLKNKEDIHILEIIKEQLDILHKNTSHLSIDIHKVKEKILSHKEIQKIIHLHNKQQNKL